MGQVMEWTPDPEDQAPFWPGSVERRGPRWAPIFVALGVMIVVVVVLIMWFGRDDDGTADQDDSATVQPDDDQQDQSADTAEGETETSDEPADDAGAGAGADADNDAGGDTGDSNEAGGTDTTTTSTTTTTVTPTTTTIPEVEAPENANEFGPSTLDTNSTVSTVGLDAVNFGMSIAEAQRAAGTPLVPVGQISDCYHVVPYDAPEGIVFLVYLSTIERVDINSGPITTRSGVGVGSPESMVIDLFGDSIDRQVRTDGTVDLVFVPKDPGDKNYRVVFNVMDGRVRSFKSGRLPQVMLDTGCEQG